MKTVVTHQLRVSPATFWERIFFDEGFNAKLYVALGFDQYQVLTQERGEGGVLRRVLRAVPPIHGPSILRRKLAGKIYYTEDGSYDPRSGVWSFRSEPSIVPDQVYIAGTITLTANAQGAEHRCELETRVTAWGMGALIERVIDKGTRDSFQTTADFTNRWAEEHGLVA